MTARGTGRTFRLVDAARGRTVAERVLLAASARDRGRGLLGRAGLSDGEGLWLAPCNGIHTFGMRFPIDVVVLDRGLRILRVAHTLRPWRVLLPAWGGHSTVELPAGTLRAAGVQVGDVLRLDGC